MPAISKHHGKSDKYKNVYLETYNGHKNDMFYNAYVYVKGKTRRKHGFKTERDAALWVDKQLIIHEKEPINILKKVK
jgi:hypothetical protein